MRTRSFKRILFPTIASIPNVDSWLSKGSGSAATSALTAYATQLQFRLVQSCRESAATRVEIFLFADPWRLGEKAGMSETDARTGIDRRGYLLSGNIDIGYRHVHHELKAYGLVIVARRGVIDGQRPFLRIDVDGMTS